MKRFFTISLIVLAFSFSIDAQEHTTKRPPASAPPATKQAPTQSAAENGGWVKFDSVAGRFSVLMPEIPEDKVQTTQSDHGPYTTHLFIVRDTRNVYLIGWVDYDPGFNFNRESELEANRDNFVKGISATLKNTRTLKIDTFPVLEFTADTSDRTFKSRVYMVGRRPYQIVIGYPKGDDDVAPVGRFFNSFKVTP
jgi:hypothetical protein